MKKKTLALIDKRIDELKLKNKEVRDDR